MFESTQKRLVRELLADSELAQRVQRLMSIPAVGEITGFDLGTGDRRPAPLSLRLGGHELLRPHGRAEVFGGQAATRSHLETAQPLAAKHSGRGGQTGAALESATGGAARPRTGTRTSQSYTLAVARKLPSLICWPSTKSGQSFQLRALLPKDRAEEEPTQKIKNRLSKKKRRNQRRSTGRSSPTRGLGRGVATPDAPYRLYRGRPENPNSYFVDRG